ncbi:MAG: linear amide C-N hydrolase, partial [Terriglobales bacterium]
MLALVTAIVLVFSACQADSCTRVVYLGPNGSVITARSMDWKTDIGTNLWILPRGFHRSGEAGPHSLEWTAKYGSVVATAYEVSSADGMNEKGLVANLLWLMESRYPEPKSPKPGLSISLWAQYVLDNFASVQEAVDALSQEPFTLITDKVPGD